MSAEPSKKHMLETPENDQIIDMLGKFSPIPSARFNKKLEQAPWIKTTSKEKKQILFFLKPSRRWLFSLAFLIVLIAFIGLSFYPPVQAVARQIIYSFMAESSDQIKIQATLPAADDLFHFSDPTNFPLSNQAAHDQAGFKVKEIINLPVGVHQVGSRFESSYGAVVTLYQGSGYDLFLTQRKIGNGEDIFSIGSTARVDHVIIGEHEGEFVMGGWKAISNQTITDTITSDNQTSINAVWDNNLPQYTLRWQADGFIYELRSVGESSPSQSELIVLANGLK